MDGVGHHGAAAAAYASDKFEEEQQKVRCRPSRGDVEQRARAKHLVAIGAQREVFASSEQFRSHFGQRAALALHEVDMRKELLPPHFVDHISQAVTLGV